MSAATAPLAATPVRNAPFLRAAGARVTAAAGRWRGAVERNAWLLLEPFLPGATLFLLLVVLSAGYLRRGFGAVRQHALAPDGGKGLATADARRRWWQCPCASRGACRCVQVAVRTAGERAGAWLRTVCGACR